MNQMNSNILTFVESLYQKSITTTARQPTCQIVYTLGNTNIKNLVGNATILLPRYQCWLTIREENIQIIQTENISPFSSLIFNHSSSRSQVISYYHSNVSPFALQFNRLHSKFFSIIIIAIFADHHDSGS